MPRETLIMKRLRSLTFLTFLGVLVVIVFAVTIDASPAPKLVNRTPTDITVALQNDAGVIVRAGAVANDGTMWWVGGLYTTVDGLPHPGLWRSTDGERWERITAAPVTGYGEVSDLYSIAASPEGVVAIGMATGGAHGNPRTVSWKLGADDILHEVRADFELYNGPRQIGVRTVARASDRWVIFGSRVNRNGLLGATSWTSATGDDFAIHDDDRALSGEPGQQRQGLDVVRSGAELIAVGEQLTTRPGFIDTDAIAWSSLDGTVWAPWVGALTQGLSLGGAGDQRAQRVAVRGERLMIAGTQTVRDTTSFVAWTRVANRWRKTRITALGVSDDPGSNVTAALVADDGFYVAVRSGDALRLAYSADGRRWTSIPLPGAPRGTRGRVGLASNGTSIIVAARSETGGAVWTLPLRADALR